MKVEIEKPNIVRFAYRQEKGDPGYGSCLWANFDFDTENYDLSIHSDCGCYGYGWTPTPKTESFLHLMSRIGKDYLLAKMCEKSRVDWNATKERLAEGIQEMDFQDEGDRECALEELEALEDEYDMVDDIGAVSVLVEKWNEETARMDDIDYYVVTDYTGDQKRIVQVFADYIQPKIREILREGATG